MHLHLFGLQPDQSDHDQFLQVKDGARDDEPSMLYRRLEKNRLRQNVVQIEREKKSCLVKNVQKPARFPSAQQDTARLVPKLDYTRGHKATKNKKINKIICLFDIKKTLTKNSLKCQKGSEAFFSLIFKVRD